MHILGKKTIYISLWFHVILFKFTFMIQKTKRVRLVEATPNSTIASLNHHKHEEGPVSPHTQIAYRTSKERKEAPALIEASDFDSFVKADPSDCLIDIFPWGLIKGELHLIFDLRIYMKHSF